MKRSTEIAINLIFWVLSIWVITEVLPFDLKAIETVYEKDGAVFQEMITDFSVWFYFGMLLKIILFYLVVFSFIPKYFNKEKVLLFSIKLILVILFFFVIEQGLIIFLEGKITEPYLFADYIIFGFYNVIAIAYGIIRKQIFVEKQTILKDKEKLQTELKLLRSQVHPHFLFNALNNLLAISERSGCTKVSEGITELSDLMRFLIYDTQVDFIKLRKEVEFIETYISLNQLRFSDEDNVNISFTVNGVNESHRITPSILIPFVENAFKHGIKTKEKSFIYIKLKIENNEMLFEVVNSFHNKIKNEFDQHYSGVGLENVRNRLQLIYENKYQLNVEEKEDNFKIALKLSLPDD